jgi:putative ABC transport system permease protein
MRNASTVTRRLVVLAVAGLCASACSSGPASTPAPQAASATGARQVLRLAAVEALVVGLGGVLAGLLLAAGIGQASFGSASFGATGATAAGWAVTAAVAGLLIATAAVLIPAWRDQRAITVTSARRTLGRPRQVWWMRYGVDLWLLLGSAVVFYLTSRNGYQLILVPEGLPTLSVNYWAFAGPAMFWAGAALLSWRLTDLLLSRGRGVMTRLSRPLAGSLSGTVAASMSRQRRVITRTVTLLALAIVFAASTAIFDATYRQQARVDALLTNGADVTVTESPGTLTPPALAQAIAKVPGVGSVEPLQHRFAYVGSDLQDLYGVRPTTVTDATRLQDAYFAGGTARQLMSILARQPDAILVSEETVRDFQLNPGDLLLTLGFTERRRTFALARVLGAHTRQLGGFVWCEVLVTGPPGPSWAPSPAGCCRRCW